MKSERLKKLQSEVRADLAKSEILNFRMPAEKIKQIYEIAERKNVRISTLLRDWITEKIHQELSLRVSDAMGNLLDEPKAPVLEPEKANQHFLYQYRTEYTSVQITKMQNLEDRMAMLEHELRELKEREFAAHQASIATSMIVNPYRHLAGGGIWGFAGYSVPVRTREVLISDCDEERPKSSGYRQPFRGGNIKKEL